MAAAGAVALVIAGITWWVGPVTRSPQSFPAAVGRPGVTAAPQQQIASWDAVIAGNVTDAIISIKAGADVNALDTRANPNGRRPLNWAAARNDTAMIRALLDAGANINSANRTGFYAITSCSGGWF
jgi:hypothetical protein